MPKDNPAAYLNMGRAGRRGPKPADSPQRNAIVEALANLLTREVNVDSPEVVEKGKDKVSDVMDETELKALLGIISQFDNLNNLRRRVKPVSDLITGFNPNSPYR